MTRLLINIFFILIICFSLSIMPVNTDALNFFDFDEVFTAANIDDPDLSEEITFEPTYEVEFNLDEINRIYNPSASRVTLTTNIPKINETLFDFEDLKLTLYKNGAVYKTLGHNIFVSNTTFNYTNDVVNVIYDLDVTYENLQLENDGFYTLGISFDSADKLALGERLFKVAYRPSIDYVSNGSQQNNGNFVYKTYFLNEKETHLVPLYFSVNYPESITLEVRNRLYNTPNENSGLSTAKIIPDRSSISKLSDEHYGVYMYSSEISKVIDRNEKAKLTLNAFIKSLTRLPHISKLSFYVDGAQVEGKLFDIDLSKVYEEVKQSYVYMTEPTSTGKRYLVPVPVAEDNIYDEIWSMFSILKSGTVDTVNWTEIIPPEVEVNNFIIDGTTITVDFNPAFLTAYDGFDEYKELMINSILYSLTSIENITKVIITVENESISTFANYDFSEPVSEPPYINFIGDY